MRISLQSCFLLLSIICGATTLTAQQKTLSPHIDLETKWIDTDRHSFDGYEFARECKRGSSGTECTAQIRRAGKTLAKFTSWISLDYGFFRLLGNKSKQLIVHTYSGGAHCCDMYYVYDLKPTLKVIYDGDKYDPDQIGGSMSIVDIDKDGIYEFRLRSQSFDYALTSHAFSPFPPVIFSYDKSKREYVISNKKFPKFIKDQLADVFEWLKRNNIQQPTRNWVVSVNSFLYFTFAGDEKGGLAYFKKHYSKKDKEDVESEMRKILEDDIVYNSIYRRR